jgi:hypothetical protein
MGNYDFDVASPAKGALDKASKAVAAFLSFLGTYVGVLAVDLANAADWVNQLVVVVGTAVGTAVVYVTKNRPKR